MNNQIEISTKTAPSLLMDVLRAGLVPMMSSSPGIGKSSIAAQIAKQQGLELIDIRLSQCDPVDLNGFPKLDGDIATYVPMDIFPVESTPLPKGKKGWLLLLDEINSAPNSVQAAAYKIVLDKCVGNRKLHPKVAMMAAGNLMTDGAITNKLSTAMQSRLVHFKLVADIKSWTEWAQKAVLDHRIISFLNFKPELLHSFKAGHDDVTFPCPRTWEFASMIATHWNTIEDEKLPVLAGTIGQGAAVEFLEYTKVYSSLPSLNDLVNNPEKVGFSDEPSVLFALSGMVASHMEATNAPPLMKFLKRLPLEFQVLGIKTAVGRDNSLFKDPAINKWFSTTARELA